MLGGKGFKFVTEVGADLFGAIDEAEALHFVNRGDSGPKGHGMRFVGMAVREVVIIKMFRDFRSGCTKTERNISRGDPLRSDENVGLDIPVIQGEPFAGAAPSG